MRPHDAEQVEFYFRIPVDYVDDNVTVEVANRALRQEDFSVDAGHRTKIPGKSGRSKRAVAVTVLKVEDGESGPARSGGWKPGQGVENVEIAVSVEVVGKNVRPDGGGNIGRAAGGVDRGWKGVEGAVAIDRKSTR